jgi:TonB family protein
MKILLALLTLACAAAQTLPDPRELLQRSDAPIFMAKTVRLVGTSSVDTTVRGATRHAGGPSFTYEFENGGRAREEIETGSSAELRIFDGANLWQYRSATSTYTTSPSSSLLLKSQLADLTYGREFTNIVSAAVEREEKLDFNGRPVPCYVVRAVYRGRVQYAVDSVERLVWLSRDQDLVLRDKWIMESSSNGTTIHVEDVADYSTIEWDVPLAAALFSFKPPPGSRLVESGNAPSAGRSPTPILTHRVEPEYTAEARAAGLQGTVSLYVEVQPDGSTSHVRVLHGLSLGLDEKAVEALEKWQFKPGTNSAGPVITRQSVNVDFRLESAGPWRVRMVAYPIERNVRKRETMVKPVLSRYVAPEPAACPSLGGRTVVNARIDTKGSPEMVIPSDGYSGPLADAAVHAVESWRFAPGTADRHPRAAEVIIELECGPPVPAPVSPNKIGGGVTAPSLAFKLEPEYSEEARRAKVQGTVVLYVEIDPTGHADNIRVIRSMGLGLDEKAIEAVTAWRFAPGMKDGRPVTVAANIEVNFRLL